MTITTLTACGSPKQLSKSVTVELGKEDGIKVTDVLDVSKDKAKDVKIDTKKVNFYKEGKYDATLTYDKKEYKVTVKVKDTVPPEVTAKTDIQAEAGTAVHISDCIDKIVEASGNVEAKFETKPDSKDAAATETTETTESTESASNTENTETTAYSSTTALGDVALNGNDEVVYADKGDYDNCVVVSDAAGNKTKTEVKIHILGKPSLTGVTDKTVNVGDTVDYMTGVSSVGDRGEDLTSAIKVDSSAVNTNAAGTYQVTYSVTEPNGYTQTATCKVTVNEKSQAQTGNNNGGSGNTKPSGNNNSSGNTKPSGGSNGGSSNGSGSTKPAGGTNNNNNNGNTTPSGGNNSTPSNNNNNQPANNNNNNGGGNSGNVNKPAEDLGDYVTCADGSKVKVDRSKWKYDTSEAGRLGPKGRWANGDPITTGDIDSVDGGNNKDGAKYFLAAGLLPQDFYDSLYGE